jgi:hypothetical protein
MSDVITAAIISATATVVAAPLVARGLTWLAEKRSQLLVVLTWNEAGKSEKLDERVRNLIRATDDFKTKVLGNDDAPFRELELFRLFFAARSYMHFSIRNNSSKKLAQLTLHDTEISDLYKIDEGDVFKVVKGQPIILGDLQPSREIELHLWSSWSVPGWNPDSKKRFKFSADELDRVVFKEPLQLFIKRRYIQRVLQYAFFILIGISIITGVVAVVLKGQQ